MPIYDDFLANYIGFGFGRIPAKNYPIDALEDKMYQVLRIINH